MPSASTQHLVGQLRPAVCPLIRPADAGLLIRAAGIEKARRFKTASSKGGWVSCGLRADGDCQSCRRTAQPSDMSGELGQEEQVSRAAGDPPAPTRPFPPVHDAGPGRRWGDTTDCNGAEGCDGLRDYCHSPAQTLLRRRDAPACPLPVPCRRDSTALQGTGGPDRCCCHYIRRNSQGLG